MYRCLLYVYDLFCGFKVIKTLGKNEVCEYLVFELKTWELWFK